MTNNYQEPLSALLDDELTDKEVAAALAEIEQEAESNKQFSRYALIGDVLRKEQELVVEDSFAASIQQALADVELPQLDESKIDSNVASIASHPKWHQRIAQKLTTFGQSNTGKSTAQFAIAASVALVAVVGVGNMQSSPSDRATSPVLTTVPLVQDLQPVSLDGAQKKPTANQVTQQRINALMADHNQQIRAADETEESDIEASEGGQ